jgi:uncharacterized DUF497 family protein
MATVVFGDFEWESAKAAANAKKHGVTFEEAATAFDDPHAIDAPDLADASRFVLIGFSHLARLLFVVNAERGSRIRIISARKATPTQRRVYEEGT